MTPPVLFTIFNRPALTTEIFGAIRAARPSRLYVAADGPRPDQDGDRDLCQQARDVAGAIDWPCTVRTLFQDRHLGCRAAMNAAIGWFFTCEESGIVLEDDCLPHPTFFDFCDRMLARYQDDDRIMCVTGNNFQPATRTYDASYYFSIYNHTWGWATWSRAWRLYDAALVQLDAFLDAYAFIGAAQSRPVAERWEDRFRLTRDNVLDSWAVAWTFSCWANSGLTITPRVNLVSNVGFGPEATHTFDRDSPGAGVPAVAMRFPLTHPRMIAANAVCDRFVSHHLFQIPTAGD